MSLLGAAIGLVFGVLGSLLLVELIGAGAYVSPSITAWGLGRGPARRCLDRRARRDLPGLARHADGATERSVSGDL